MARSQGTAICTECGKPYTTLNQTIKRTIKRFGRYVCPECAKILGREKAKQTLLKKYGVDNPMKDPEVFLKNQESHLKNNGYTTPFADPEVREKIKQEYFEKTGYDNPGKNPEVKEKMKETCLNKYDREYALSAPEVRERIISSMYENGSVPTSKPQLECFNIIKNLDYEAVLNYPMGPLSFDILIKTDNIMIDFEYDGWYWHQDKRKDCARNAVVLKQGYKIFRVKAFSNIVPTEDQITKGLEELINTDKQIYYIEIQ